MTYTVELTSGMPSELVDLVRQWKERGKIDNMDALGAEMAVKKLLGVENLGKRVVRYCPTGTLRVFRNDPLDARLILVTGEAPVYRVVGYISGRTAKASEYRFQNHWTVPSWVLTEIPEAAVVSAYQKGTS